MLTVPTWARVAISCCLLGVPLGMGFWMGGQFDTSDNPYSDDVAEALESVATQQREVDDAKQEAARRFQAVSLRLAKMQAQLSRLEALGEILTEKAELSDGEFNFNAAPALGGPISEDYNSLASERGTMEILQTLSHKIEDRSIQLNIVAELIQDRHIKRETLPSGLPAEKGWISSGYGTRVDPFNGNKAWHNGVDIAGKLGSGVTASASGVVTAAGQRTGYGNMVEITHDNGFVTRYGHNKDISVALGEIVKKGQVISSMGNTGRSTGPHVHFEVYKHGRSVDPASYIRQTVR